jgi:hypothetical protein
MKYIVVPSEYDQNVHIVKPDYGQEEPSDDYHQASFSGYQAQKHAQEYADWKNKQEEWEAAQARAAEKKKFTRS